MGRDAVVAGAAADLMLTRVPAPSWWTEAESSFPISSVDGARDVWQHGPYAVVVRYDPMSGVGRLSLRDSTSREWALGRVPAPVSRILWLDRPALDSTVRSALDRAFEESSLYDDNVRTASLSAPPRLRRGARRHQLARQLVPHRAARRHAKGHHA